MFFEARRFMGRLSSRQETSVSKSAQGWARYMPPRPISGGRSRMKGTKNRPWRRTGRNRPSLDEPMDWKEIVII